MAPVVGPLMFNVRRKSPELIRPAKPTPKEYKLLSDIDDQEGLRFHMPMIHFYRHNPTMEGKDPVKVIREALAQALVFYYPFAGRLREGPGRKLMVDCTGEGVLFIEADADVALEEFGDALLLPPCPCLEELLYDVPGSQGVLHSPLILIQVTRLRRGGFIFALRFNHTMSDGFGLNQFMSAIGEIGRGAASPSILPVWRRDLLSARDPPRICYNHQEYDQIPDTKATIIPLDHMVHLSFFFGPTEISAIRKLLPSHLLEKCSRFDILTACIWRCRTLALQPDPDEEVRALCIVNARAKLNHPLPVGYYGNAVAMPAAITTAEKLCNNPLAYAVELVMKAKSDVTEEYIRSVADFLAIKGRPHFSVVRTFIVSDVTRVGFGEVDFGWGDAVYGGPAKGGVGDNPGVSIFYIPFRNKKGESRTIVPICLPALAMEKFVNEINSIVNPSKHEESIRKKKSAL